MNASIILINNEKNKVLRYELSIFTFRSILHCSILNTSSTGWYFHVWFCILLLFKMNVSRETETLKCIQMLSWLLLVFFNCCSFRWFGLVGSFDSCADWQLTDASNWHSAWWLWTSLKDFFITWWHCFCLLFLLSRLNISIRMWRCDFRRMKNINIKAHEHIQCFRS